MKKGFLRTAFDKYYANIPSCICKKNGEQSNLIHYLSDVIVFIQTHVNNQILVNEKCKISIHSLNGILSNNKKTMGGDSKIL